MKTLLFDKLHDNKVKCGMCSHFCVIEDGKCGICQVRKNIKGELFSLVYLKLIARGIDPIEKKPIFHMKPGSKSYSIATAGCNFKCSFCQNSDISQVAADRSAPIRGVDVPPEIIVQQALRGNCASIAYTYTEPTVFFELAMETAKIARQHGLLNIFITNGFMSTKLIEMMAGLVDAVNVDLKAFNEVFYKKQCKARLEPVKENLILMKSLGILVEVTTLLIPGLNDDPDEIAAMAEFIAERLGEETPWHISRFHPCYKMTTKDSTPLNSLKYAFLAGKKAGLKYVYTGNAPGLDSENTFCPGCGTLLIKRFAYNIENKVSSQGKCPECNTDIYGIF